MRHEFADGKYTVINDNGKLTALRHGEPWGRDLVGDNLVYWMLVEVDTLKAVNQELRKALNKLVDHIDFIPTDPYYRNETKELMDAARAAIAKAEAQK
jgi:hypothetical protein